MLLGFSGDDGSEPVGPLAIDANGAIYGTTLGGGSGGQGVVFRLAPPSEPGGAWTESTIYPFGGTSGVVLGAGGVLYGTLSGSTCPGYCGNVFQLSPPSKPGGAWTETLLYTFGGAAVGDGSEPDSPPIVGPSGVLYGTTTSGGAYGWGTIYKLAPPSAPGESWAESVLYSFTGDLTGGTDGGEPYAVALGPDGNLYGTTQLLIAKGGSILGYGTVFQLVLQ